MKKQQYILVFSCLAIIVVLVVISAVLLILRASEAIAPELKDQWPTGNRSLLSQPLDPWSVSRTTVDTHVVFLPMEEGGQINLDIQDVPIYLNQSWGYYSPRNVGTNQWFDTMNLFESMQVYSPTRTYPADEKTLKSASQILGATHTVRLSRERSTEEDVYTITLDHNSTTLTGTVAVGSDAVFDAVSEINRWIVETIELKVSDREETALYAPYFGMDYQNDEDLPEDYLSWPYESDKWTNAVERSSGIDTWKVVQSNAMVGQQNKTALLEIAGDPLPSGSPLVDRFIRAKCLYYAGEFGAAYHEYALIVAEHPGKQFYVSRLFFQRLEKKHMGATAVEYFRQWHNRAPASNVADWYQAEFLNKVAWALRGEGFVNTVPANVWPVFHSYVDESKSLFEKVINDAGPIPYIVQTYISTIGTSENDPAKIRQLADSVSKLYPDWHMVWSNAINYNRPRWGGNHQTAMDMLDMAMDRAPKNPRIANLVYSYHDMEAIQFKDISHPFNSLEAWTDANPRHKAQRDRAFEILMNSEPKEKCTAMAFYFAVSFNYDEGRNRAYLAMPDRNFLDYFHLSPPYYHIDYTFNIPMTMLGHREWENLAKFFEDLKEYEEQYRFVNVDERFKKPLGNGDIFPYFKSFILMSKGDRDGAIALLDQGPILRRNYSFFYLWAKVAMDDINDRDVIEAEKLLAERLKEKPTHTEDHLIMAACVNRRAGNIERCQKLVALYQQKYPKVNGDLFEDNYRIYAETGREFIWK